MSTCFDALLAAADSPWSITWHAVERYCERVADVAVEEAIAELARLSREAYLTGAVTPSGEDVWMAVQGDTMIPLIVKTGVKALILVTVYHPREITQRVSAAEPVPLPKHSRSLRLERQCQREAAAIAESDDGRR